MRKSVRAFRALYNRGIIRKVPSSRPDSSCSPSTRVSTRRLSIRRWEIFGRAEANLGKTQLDVARYTPLAKEGAISQQELDNAIQAHQANKASVEAARATVERAKLNLSWTKVTAPITGIAGISVAQIGDLVTPSALLTTLSQVDPIKVYYPISEQEYMHFAQRIREIEAGRGGQRPPLELTLADGSVYPERGTFSLADRQVDLRTGTITVQGLFANPDNLLRPGQYAKIRVAAETRKGAMLVPQQAVQQLQGSNQVVVVGDGNKIDIRPVKVGEQVRVISGLSRKGSSQESGSSFQECRK